MAFSLACDAGKTTLRIEGTDNNVTWNDVANAGADSVAVDGGGTEDPSFFVTEHAANAVYQILKNIQFGDGTNALTFYSKNEMVYFNDDKAFTIEANAVLQLGVLYGSWGLDGSVFSIDLATNPHIITSAGTLILYNSRLHSRAAAYVKFTGGIITAENSIFSAIWDSDSDYHRAFRFEGGTITFNKVYISNVASFFFITSPTMVDVHAHRVGEGVVITDANLTISGLLVSSYNTYDARMKSAHVLSIKNPEFNVSSPKIDNANGIIKEQYACDIHVIDKDGNDLEGVTVTCEDKNSNQVFSVQTGDDGHIAQQIINHKKWEGTDETETEYSPHKFTFAKDGYTLLVMENVTVDALINWDIEVKFPERIRARMANPGRLAILR